MLLGVLKDFFLKLRNLFKIIVSKLITSLYARKYILKE